MQVCPHKAIKSKSDPFSLMDQYKYKIALPEPALYGQFHNLDDVNIILNGLLALGFDRVWEVAAAGELLAYYAQQEKNRHAAMKKRPLLSSGCPAVVRLIRMRFPKLIEHIGTVLMPAEIAAQLAREEAVKETGLSPEEIGVFLISPCASKVTAVHNPEGKMEATIDGAFAIKDIYLRLLNPMRDLTELKPLRVSGRLGSAWAIIGGESKSRKDHHHIAVDGIDNVIRLLEELEDGRIPEADFIELSACTNGCLGGCFNVENPFAARMRLEMVLDKMPRLGDRFFLEEEEKKFIQYDRELDYSPVFVLDNDRMVAMEKAIEIDSLCNKLPGLDCGSCGAPSCYAHAEDVVMGRGSEEDCIFRLREKMRSAMKDGEDYLPLPFRRRKNETE
jgi:hypothetical protein